jgi:hypothetical protein
MAPSAARGLPQRSIVLGVSTHFSVADQPSWLPEACLVATRSSRGRGVVGDSVRGGLRSDRQATRRTETQKQREAITKTCAQVKPRLTDNHPTSKELGHGKLDTHACGGRKGRRKEETIYERNGIPCPHRRGGACAHACIPLRRRRRGRQCQRK